jgi:hypothetical protein
MYNEVKCWFIYLFIFSLTRSIIEYWNPDNDRSKTNVETMQSRFLPSALTDSFGHTALFWTSLLAVFKGKPQVSRIQVNKKSLQSALDVVGLYKTCFTLTSSVISFFLSRLGIINGSYSYGRHLQGTMHFWWIFTSFTKEISKITVVFILSQGPCRFVQVQVLCATYFLRQKPLHKLL